VEVITWSAFALGWLRGGHVERLSVAVLFWDYVFTHLVAPTGIGDAAAMASTIVATLVILWLAFRSERWWLLVTAASLTLCSMVHIMEWMVPGLSQYAAESAQLGLWIVVFLSLIAGVGERWLAGERAVSDTAVWRRRRGAA
jgi:hypothetical protein